MTWYDIKDAPKDGQMLFSWANFKGSKFPVFFAWCNLEEKKEIIKKGWLPFWKSKTTIKEIKSGWRILILGRDCSYNVHGNYGWFYPTKFQYLETLPE